MAKQAQIDAVRPVLTEIDRGVTATEHAIDAVVSNADKASDILESGLEKVADIVPEAFDKSVHLTADVTRQGVRALRNPRTVAFIVIGTSMVAGASLGLLGYKLMKKRLEKQYEDRLNAELDEMRAHYIRRSKAGKFATARTAAEELLTKEAVEALDNYQGNETPKDKTDPEPTVPVEPSGRRYDKVMTNSQAAQTIRDQVVKIEETVTSNVFVNGKALVPDEWDAEAEEARRVEGIPYIISQEEYMENSFEHEQTLLTYYAGDDVLADDKETMIEDVESIVGTENLARFGHGSSDPNTVYIRNERNEADYEVVLNSGRFSEEVMGLRHSNESPHLRKVRWGDNE